MAKRRLTHRPQGHIPFVVFVILLIAIVGVYLHKRAVPPNGDRVLGWTYESGQFNIFSFDWWRRLIVGDNASDLMRQLSETRDDGGASDFASLEKEAAGL